MKTIDATGMDCPAPVLKTKEIVEMESPKDIIVYVDNAAAQQNVARFLQAMGYDTHMDKTETHFFIKGEYTGVMEEEDSKHAFSYVCDAPLKITESRRILVMITSDRIGHGDDELGRKLMVNFVKTLKEMGQDLWRLVFVNNGVRLVVDGSELIAELKGLESEGLHILVCGTCLDHFKLLDKKAVGETTNMLDIVTSMQVCDLVINM